MPFYASVDLRNAGFKLAPVDTNLFPGGFNNLNPVVPAVVRAGDPGRGRARVSRRARRAAHSREPHAQRVLPAQRRDARGHPAPGRHARAHRLAQSRDHRGDEARPAATAARSRSSRCSATAGAWACTTSIRAWCCSTTTCRPVRPQYSQDIDQPVVPPLAAGWYNRRKSHHFAAYSAVAEQFAALVGIDPWLIDPYFGVCGKIDFQERAGEDCLASNVDDLLARISAKYAEYGIEEKPFVIVKADAGTYGMGIMTVRDVDDVRDLNRKQRNKMAIVKEGLEVTSVIIQEGVPTFESINDAIAEPVVYMIDRFVVGGFYRVHTARGKDENLNAPGAQFVPLAFESPCIPDLREPAGLRAQPLLRVRRRRAPRAACRGPSRSRSSRRARPPETVRRVISRRVLPAPRALQPLDERADVRRGSRAARRGAQARPRRVLRLAPPHAQSHPVGRPHVARPLHGRAVHGRAVRRRHVRRLRGARARARRHRHEDSRLGGQAVAASGSTATLVYRALGRRQARANCRRGSRRRICSSTPRITAARRSTLAQAGRARHRRHRPAVLAGVVRLVD